MFGVPASNLYGSSFQVDFSNVTERIMSPPPRNGGISSSSASLAVEDADPGRAVQLVPGHHVEVAVERLHVDRHVIRRLRAVDEHRHARARARARSISSTGLMVPERVRHVRHGHEPASARRRAPRTRRACSSPRSSIGTTRSRAPRSSQSICHGTMFEWCSIAEISTSSPARTIVYRGRPDQPGRRSPGHQPDRRRARHGGLRARPQPGEGRPQGPGHLRAVLRQRASCPRTTCSATRAPASSR